MLDWGSCVENGVATLRCIPIVFSNIIFWIGGLAAITTVFFIIFAGIKFLNSGGDPKQVEGARKTLTFAIIGFVLILLSFTIIRFIAAFTGTSSCVSPFLSFKIC